ncbi:MAG: zinc-ribbon domain-containing protein [Pseudodesulfovibrio sp.]|nr:zinc-ribbon domain-containing protein [Pseudodesulfovibrio sp.]
MIICTKCGEKNSDEIRFCTQCGKKLQSSRQCLIPLTDSSNRCLESFKHQGVSPGSWTSLMRMVEAWGYVAVLAVVATMCAIWETWWPLYPAVGLIGLMAWIRRI